VLELGGGGMRFRDLKFDEAGVNQEGGFSGRCRPTNTPTRGALARGPFVVRRATSQRAAFVSAPPENEQGPTLSRQPSPARRDESRGAMPRTRGPVWWALPGSVVLARKFGPSQRHRVGIIGSGRIGRRGTFVPGIGGNFANRARRKRGGTGGPGSAMISGTLVSRAIGALASLTGHTPGGGPGDFPQGRCRNTTEAIGCYFLFWSQVGLDGVGCGHSRTTVRSGRERATCVGTRAQTVRPQCGQ